MKVTISVDTDQVAYDLEGKHGAYVDMVDGIVANATLDEVVDSVISNTKFEFDRDDISAVVLKFPELTR